jgi:hypothetical protein
MITREAIEIFVNSNAFIKNIDKQFDEEFGRGGAKIGNTLRIRLPNDYTIRHGVAASVQDTAEQSTTLTMATQDGVDVSFTQADLLLSLDDFAERILLPMMNNLAGDVATTIMAGVEGGVSNITANLSGSNVILAPGSQQYLDAGAILRENSAPMANRKIINDPRTESKVVNSLAGLLNPASAIEDQYYEGVMYRALGGLWFNDQTILKHTAGTYTGTGQISGANQTGTTLAVSSIVSNPTTTNAFNAGDIITISGVNGVNRVNKSTTGLPRQFVVVQAVANGATSIVIYPAIIPPNPSTGAPVQFQTVTASPANNAPIAMFTQPGVTYRKNLVYAPQMITMATGDLPLPRGVEEAARHMYDKVSMRSVTQYVIGTDQSITRLDVLFGFLFVRPEWGVVVADSVP